MNLGHGYYLLVPRMYSLVFSFHHHMPVQPGAGAIHQCRGLLAPLVTRDLLFYVFAITCVDKPGIRVNNAVDTNNVTSANSRVLPRVSFFCAIARATTEPPLQRTTSYILLCSHNHVKANCAEKTKLACTSSMVGMLSTVRATRAFLLESRNREGVCRMKFLKAILPQPKQKAIEKKKRVTSTAQNNGG